MQSCALRFGLLLGLTAALVGCGGGGYGNKPNPATAVAQVTLSPATISVVAGEVVQLSFAAVNGGGGTPSPTPTFTFNSSNTKVATVSPSGLVCGGVWDSFFIVCNGNDAQGNPISGTAQITASAGGVSSAPSLATVHASVTSIQITQSAGNAFPACNSVNTTSTWTAKVFHNATDITNQVGPVNWSSVASGVASIDTNGVATATTPGLTGVIASVGTVSSSFEPLKTCMPIQITLHINNDPAGQPTESANMNVNDSRILQVDMVDEAGVTTNSAPIPIISNNTLVTTLAPSTLTTTLAASTPGGAGLIAACVPTSATAGCGAGLNTPVYSNLFSVSVNSSSPFAFVYATSSFAPPSGTTPTMIPVDTSKTPIAAGTAINLPGVPNSLVFSRDGTKGFMGTSAGIAVLDTATNGVTAISPFIGKVLAVSPNGAIVVLSNAANDPGTGTPIQPDVPSQRLALLNTGTNAVATFVLPGAISADFTADSSKAFIGVNDGHVYVFSNFQSLQTTLTLSGNPAISDVAVVPGSAYAFFATPSGLQVMAACNNMQQPAANNPPTTTNTIQFVRRIDNANMIVAVDTTGVDIETATINSILSTNPTIPFTLNSTNCAPPVSYSNEFHDFGVGPFTARQLVTPTNGLGGNNGSHVMVLPVGMNQLLVAAPGQGIEVIPLAGSATEALSGAMNLDGNTAWIGAAGSNDLHQILLTNSPGTADAFQLAMPFKKSDGSPAPPNIVGIKPH